MSVGSSTSYPLNPKRGINEGLHEVSITSNTSCMLKPARGVNCS